jgi:DnaK suppressor protein
MLEAPTMAKLTEQDVIKWDGEDYMNADHLEFFKDQLLQMQQELLSNASATANHLQEQEATPDPADRATLEEEYALELRTRDRERKLLQKIQASLRQIEDGSYGFCEDTGEPIGLKRLIARPTATLSVEAQERRERMKRQYAD